jgi:hypothetical protein
MTEGEHYNDRYIRYHSDIYMPEHIVVAALGFLPPGRMQLPMSNHYEGLRDARRLPPSLSMPDDFDIVDVTIIRDTLALFRVCIRFSWPGTDMLDLIMVLEGDHEVVSAYWNARDDRHGTLDPTMYVKNPEEFDDK